MRDKVLLVDDDANVLAGYKRQLRKVLVIETAASGVEGLEVLRSSGPFAVVVSDLRMPGMDGIQFLSRAREMAPDTVRVMLTGFADVKNAIEAVNEGKLFRFLTKPCETTVLAKALAEGIKQYRLVTAERELLDKTLSGSVKVLTELLSLVKPEAFGRASRIAALVNKIAGAMNAPQRWAVGVAGALSQIGLITLPDNLIRRVSKGRRLSPEEQEMFNGHPQMAADLIANIPRLDEVAAIIAHQEKNYDGSGPPADSDRGEDIPLGARILKAAIDFDALTLAGLAKGEALAEMTNRPGFYDPGVLAGLRVVLGEEAKYAFKEVSVYGLKEKMILAEDVFSVSPRRMLLAKGQEISPSIIEYMKKFQATIGVEQPIKVIDPVLVR